VTNRWGILALIMAAQTMANLGPLGIPAIAPLIRDSFGLSTAQAGSFLSAYYIGPSLMSLPAGRMVDRWGVSHTMVLGQVVIALGLFAVAGSWTFALLSVLIVLAGAGYGMLNPSTAKAVLVWFPREHRATVVGLKQVGLPFGGAMGALIMPPLALWLGWRETVALSASVIGGLAVLTWLLYREPPGAAAEGGRAGGGSLGAVLRNRDLWLVSASTLMFAGMQTVWMAYLVLYLRDVVAMPLLTAARFLVLAQLTGTVGRVVFGILSDRVFGGRRRAVLVLAGLGSTACTLLIAGTGSGTSPWHFAVLAAVFGFVGIGWNGVQYTLMAELVDPRSVGTAVGLGLAVSSFGVTVCPPLFGALVERVGGWTLPWVALAVAMMAGLGLLMLVRETRVETPA
jgi:ACS family hexuronate transporter-like MFS transporter